MSAISTRSAAKRAGGRAGHLAGLVSRTTKDRMSRDRACKLAAEHPVSDRWRPVFERAFVRAAIQAAHVTVPMTTGNVELDGRSKYGMP